MLLHATQTALPEVWDQPQGYDIGQGSGESTRPGEDGQGYVRMMHQQGEQHHLHKAECPEGCRGQSDCPENVEDRRELHDEEPLERSETGVLAEKEERQGD